MIKNTLKYNKLIWLIVELREISKTREWLSKSVKDSIRTKTEYTIKEVLDMAYWMRIKQIALNFKTLELASYYAMITFDKRPKNKLTAKYRELINYLENKNFDFDIDDIMNLAFNEKDENEFTFSNIEEAKESANKTWKTRPTCTDSKLYQYRARAKEKWMNSSDILDMVFWMNSNRVKPKFTFTTIEEWVKIAKQEWKERPKYKNNKTRSLFENNAKRQWLKISEIFDIAFWKIDLRFPFEDFKWAVEFLKNKWKINTKDKEYASIARYCHKRWIFISQVIDYAFWNPNRFEFVNRDEAIKEMNTTWDKLPSCTSQKFKDFNWRAWLYWINFKNLLKEKFSLTLPELKDEESIKSFIKKTYPEKPFINKEFIHSSRLTTIIKKLWIKKWLIDILDEIYWTDKNYFNFSDEEWAIKAIKKEANSYRELLDSKNRKFIINKLRSQCNKIWIKYGDVLIKAFWKLEYKKKKYEWLETIEDVSNYVKNLSKEKPHSRSKIYNKVVAICLNCDFNVSDVMENAYWYTYIGGHSWTKSLKNVTKQDKSILANKLF